MRGITGLVALLLIGGAIHCDAAPEAGKAEADERGLANPSFEEGGGWVNLQVGDDAYFAPVDGTRYAVIEGPQTGSPEPSPLSQVTSQTLASGQTARLTVWARSIYADDRLNRIRNRTMDTGVTARAVAELEVGTADSVLATASLDVSPIALQGAPTRYSSDDGANVWIDGDYRMAAADHIFFQPVSADPITDPWQYQPGRPSSYDALLGPIITPEGLRAIYGTFYDDSSPATLVSFIDAVQLRGAAPAYQFDTQDPILEHSGSENPWVIDPHLYYEPGTQKLWMTWGGHRIWVTELDPATGEPVRQPTGASIEFVDFPAGSHTEILSFASEPGVGAHPDVPANWDGDEWSTGYVEGAALYKHGEHYYAFGSYGSLGRTYTIRMGRSRSPQGPYIDKDGYELTTFYPAIHRYGASMLLGHDGDHLVPGHPHIWAENGTTYLGYDYRTDLSVSESNAVDRMGIRRLHWVNGWPTVWQPITVTIRADDHPSAIGEPLRIRLRNIGDPGSTLAVDHVEWEIQ